nr:glycosyl hydrolase family 28-related protein [uncultured Celeribacter sp.]
MNMAVTGGLVLMPPAFSEGLDLWSSEDGTAGSASFDGAPNAALVAADADFGGCLELVKTDATVSLRYMGQTPLIPGLYLRISARIKAISGNLPDVRIAGWAGDGSDAHVSGLVETGSAVSLSQYGEVIEVSAIVGSGAREGVDMAWGLTPAYGHFGLDLTGATGGTVRIDDLVIEDVSSWFQEGRLGVLDVRDFGAVGDGVTECLAAFQAADAAAAGRKIRVPEGVYVVSDTLSMEHEVIFAGTLSMPSDKRLTLQQEFHLNSYIAAFGNEVEGIKRALQALFSFTDHDSLDLCGRRIELDEPLDLAALSGVSTHEVRRVLRNGQFNVQASPAWDVVTVSSTASYTTGSAKKLTNVVNIANIAVGSLVTGTGVGREIYVREVNVAAQTLTLSRPLYGASASQSYDFTRFQYVLDFSGFAKLSQFEIFDVEFLCQGVASAILLAPDGFNFHLRDCHVKAPLNRGVTSIGEGCQDLHLDRCFFVSSEQSLPAQSRQSVAFNVNANDSKIRDNRFQRFGHTGVVSGNGHLFVGNHWFQGDNDSDSPRTAGLIFTTPNVKSVITGNYLDNSFIEMTNEHDATPDFSAEYSFGGLTVTGNIFTVNDSADWFAWIVVTPYGAGHFIQGLSVQNNTFKSLNGSVDRVEKIDTTYADLEYGAMRNITFAGNTFNGVSQNTINPVSLEFSQNSAASQWVLDPSDYLPFGGRARIVESVVIRDALLDGGGAEVFDAPTVVPDYGVNNAQVQLRFGQPVRGTAHVVARMDRPI